MTTNKKVIDKLHKLLALAEQGEGGEKVTAQRMLDKMLKKHGLTMTDIANESTEVYWFTYKGSIEKQLLSQIIFAVSPLCERWKRKGSKTITGAKLTKSEMLDIELRFSVYSKAIKEDIEIFVNAFIMKNDIYPEDSDTFAKEIGEETPEEKAKRFRTSCIAEGIEKKNVLKSIASD